MGLWKDQRARSSDRKPNRLPSFRSREDDHPIFAPAISSQARQNSFICSGVPREMRAFLASGGKGRPILTLCLAKASMRSRIGQPVSIITKLAEEGIGFNLRAAAWLRNS